MPIKNKLFILLLILGVVSCVSLDKNIKSAEEMLYQAQSIGAKVYAPKEFNEATVSYIAAKLHRFDNKKLAKGEAISSWQMARLAYHKSIGERMKKQVENNLASKNRALENNSQILAKDIYNEAELMDQSTVDMRKEIEALSKTSKVLELNKENQK